MKHTPDLERMTTNAWFSKTEKLHNGQIAAQKTWGGVPDVNMTKAAMHVIRVRPAGGGYSVTEMFELDPGIVGATVTEGRGWKVIPAGSGQLAVHGRTMR
ncbi:MAG: hypothetical protein ACREMY_00895 [bacterium]